MKKSPKFFGKLKSAVFNFDEYKTFAEERLSSSIIYLLKVMVIFTILITICLEIRIVQEVNIIKQTIEEKCPQFTFEDNNLVIDENSKQFIIEENQINSIIIIDSEKESLEEIDIVKENQNIIAFLKDKIITKNNFGVENVIYYSSLSEDIALSTINKQVIIDLLGSNAMIIGYLVFSFVAISILYIGFTIQITIDILLLSLIAFLLSKIIGLRLKYTPIFNISVYALTLSIFLYMVYIIVNLFTGFNIVYFDVAYRAISYIYVATALLIIKSDLIKQNMELTKIVEVQKQVRGEKQQKEEKKEDEEDKKEKEKKEDKKEKNSDNEEPEGNEA